MGKHKRVNPHKRPATAADVERAKRDAQTLAIDCAWAIFFTVLRDKEGYGCMRLRRVWNHVNYLSESIADGRVSIQDLMQTLRDEAGITLEGHTCKDDHCG